MGSALVVRPALLGIPLPWAWVERGPVVGTLHHLAPCIRAIDRAARARGIARLHVMPYWADDAAILAERDLSSCGYRDVQRVDGAHACTLRIDLRDGAERDLFAGKSKAQVRWRAAQAERAGATSRRGEAADWIRLRRMHASLMEGQGRRDRGTAWWTALETMASDERRGALFVAEYRGRVVAGCVVLRHGPQATYAWGASVADKLPFTKAIPPLVAAIRWARAAGCTVFDLGGIPLEGDVDRKRRAIATLKRDFERRPVRLVRGHARWLLP